jgi:hypothetical protein
VDSDPDADPDTAIFVTDLQDANKDYGNLKISFSALFEGTFT